MNNDLCSVPRYPFLYCIRNSDTAAHTFNCRVLKEERMQKSRELNHDFSAVCVLITKHLAKFCTKLEKSHSDLRFFVRSFGWNLVQLLGIFHPNFASFQAQ